MNKDFSHLRTSDITNLHYTDKAHTILYDPQIGSNPGVSLLVHDTEELIVNVQQGGNELSHQSRDQSEVVD